MVPERRLTTVRVPEPLLKKFERKDKRSQAALLTCFRQLREDWRQGGGLRTKQLKGRTVDGSPVYEARASRGDRVTFFVDGGVITIENHCTHQQVLGK